MSLTLLLDLDDTLLANSMDSFLPAYLQALSGHLSAYAEPTQIITALMAGTRQMVQNQQPNCTLGELFDSVFYPMLGWQKADLEQSIAAFYTDAFPKLRQHSRPAEGGVELVEEAFKRGYRVAIATNPLFPFTAINQRLEWAGLPLGKYPFHLVSSFETFHFAKPHPAYLAEVLARLGWPEGPVVMVGDDCKNDIEPAQQLGLASYWLGGALKPSQNRSGLINGSGTLKNFFGWLDGCDLRTLEPDFSTPTAMLNTLRATPAALSSICSQFTPLEWTRRAYNDEWSPAEIMCHLRDVETEVNLSRLRKVLKGNNPFVPGMDTDRWAEERQYNQQDGRRALQRFSTSRQRSLRLLDQISVEQWDLPARHAIFGPTRLREMVGITAGHDRLHLRQLIMHHTDHHLNPDPLHTTI